MELKIFRWYAGYDAPVFVIAKDVEEARNLYYLDARATAEPHIDNEEPDVFNIVPGVIGGNLTSSLKD